ncbi:MAG TPA: restriction endonuclease [Burkholderiales bacterium]|nr:restriction endonuclease [Burkholderiales bacterium]
MQADWEDGGDILLRLKFALDHREANEQARRIQTAMMNQLIRPGTGSLSLAGQKAEREVGRSGELLVQMIVVPGAKTHEGTLIEAVTPFWTNFVELINRDPTAMHQLGPREWEEFIAGAYKKAGYDDVILTPRSGDFGRDVIATKRGLGTVRVIDQVKAYKPGHLVTADDVRALLGVVEADGASKGFLTTTSDFAPRLRDDILLKPQMQRRLELINGEQLRERLATLARKT